MANPITPEIKTGTIGELLVQIRLLQYGVQAAQPLKDSGNDLIALRGEAIRTIQVKTTTGALPPWPPTEKIYHLLAIVMLRGEENELQLDGTEIFLIPKSQLAGLARNWQAVSQYRISQQHVHALFQP
jgi:hypothetical protein